MFPTRDASTFVESSMTQPYSKTFPPQGLQARTENLPRQPPQAQGGCPTVGGEIFRPHLYDKSLNSVWGFLVRAKSKEDARLEARLRLCRYARPRESA